MSPAYWPAPILLGLPPKAGTTHLRPGRRFTCTQRAWHALPRLASQFKQDRQHGDSLRRGVVLHPIPLAFKSPSRGLVWSCAQHVWLMGLRWVAGLALGRMPTILIACTSGEAVLSFVSRAQVGCIVTGACTLCKPLPAEPNTAPVSHSQQPGLQAAMGWEHTRWMASHQAPPLLPGGSSCWAASAACAAWAIIMRLAASHMASIASAPASAGGLVPSRCMRCAMRPLH